MMEWVAPPDGAGNSGISGTGNSQSNMLSNVLNGGAAADTMEGDAGNDTYVIDSVSDRIIEAAGAGADTVETSLIFLGSGT